MKRSKLIIVLLSIALSAFGLSCAQRADQARVLSAPTVIAESGQTEWDLTVLGDSDMWNSFNFYSKYFEEDLGVSITVHNQTMGGAPTTRPLTQLQEFQYLRDLISESEIVVFNVPFVNPGVGGACFISSYTFEDDGCFDMSMEEYAETTRAIITEIKSLVGDSGAMIRLQNMFIPTRWWETHSSLADRTQPCFECYAAYWEAQAKVAEEEGIPVVDVFTLFHGLDHDQDPYDKGYIGADLIHTNTDGAKAIADLYRETGYEYWKP
jgi:hypothetical protein